MLVVSHTAVLLILTLTLTLTFHPHPHPNSNPHHSLMMGTSCKVELQPECDSSTYFDGAIDDLAFFAGALTDAEVRERWANPNPKPNPKPNPNPNPTLTLTLTR